MKSKHVNYLVWVSIVSMILLAPGSDSFEGRAKGSAKNGDDARQGERANGGQLDQTSGYDSLMEAVKQARFKGVESQEEPQAEELVLTRPKKATATDGAPGDRFGYQVAIAGDTAVVGAPLDDVGSNADQGSAYVFVRVGASWVEQAKLTAADGAAGDSFGYSVAITNVNGPAQTVIMVGTWANDISSNPNQGSVYVFVRSSGGTTWSPQGNLVASDGAANDAFGNSVAMSGSFAIIGANGVDNGVNVSEGAAYIFVRSGTVWVEEQKLTIGTPAAHLNFGWSVGISGTMAIVGSNHTKIDNGFATIFERVTGGNTWVRGITLTAPGKAGYSVGISGSTIIIGAYGADIGSNPNQGRAYIYSKVGELWNLQGAIETPDGMGNDAFGSSVAISGDLAIIGANGVDVGAVGDRGAAYVYSRSGTTWTQQRKIIAADGVSGDNMGFSIALSRNVAIIGAPFADVSGNIDRGSAYIFTLSTPFDFDGDSKADVSVFRPPTGAWYLMQSTAGFAGTNFGQNGDKIVPADYDGDGRTDIAVYRAGIWYLLRSSLGFTAFNFGLSTDIPAPADYDGDGIDDIAVFRPSDGTWYLQRSTAGYASTQFGQAGDVPVAGDYDGDGVSDVAVWRPSNGVWYLMRSTAGFTFFAFGQAGDRAVPADYDGDGRTDMAVYRGGTWYLQRSLLGFTSEAFGLSADVPVAANYDGDRATDLAVFRPSDGTWYLKLSTGSLTSVPFGTASDLPVPAAYVP